MKQAYLLLTAVFLTFTSFLSGAEELIIEAFVGGLAPVDVPELGRVPWKNIDLLENATYNGDKPNREFTLTHSGTYRIVVNLNEVGLNNTFVLTTGSQTNSFQDRIEVTYPLNAGDKIFITRSREGGGSLLATSSSINVFTEVSKKRRRHRRRRCICNCRCETVQNCHHDKHQNSGS
jgi:hypothetical protein